METTTALEIAIREAREIDCEIKALTEKKTALTDRIKKELEIGESVTVDGVRASLRPGNRKFSMALALSVLPEDLKLKCVRPMIDEKMVRQTVDALGWTDQCMETADPSKTILDLAK